MSHRTTKTAIWKHTSHPLIPEYRHTLVFDDELPVSNKTTDQRGEKNVLRDQSGGGKKAKTRFQYIHEAIDNTKVMKSEKN